MGVRCLLSDSIAVLLAKRTVAGTKQALKYLQDESVNVTWARYKPAIVSSPELVQGTVVASAGLLLLV